MSATTLNAIGLTFNVVGGVLMFFFGVPAYPQRTRAGQSYLLLERDDNVEKRRVIVADRIAKLGVALLILGFVIQLIALLR
jgi:hypothetical protein